MSGRRTTVIFYAFIVVIVLAGCVWADSSGTDGGEDGDVSKCSADDQTCSAGVKDSVSNGTADDNDEGLPLTEAEEPLVNAMKSLFETDERIESFFETHFERTSMFFSHTDRSNRTSWMKSYRRFIPSAGLNALLNPNRSVSDCSGPLQLHVDIDVIQVSALDEDSAGEEAEHEVKEEEENENEEEGENENDENDEEEDRNDDGKLYAWKSLMLPPSDLNRMQEAVSDGATLRIHGMDARVRDVTIFVNSLRDFWQLPVSTTFTFIPVGTTRFPGPAPGISASELFMICLDGVAAVQTYGEYFAHPLSHHVDSARVLRTAAADLIERETAKHERKNKKSKKSDESSESDSETESESDDIRRWVMNEGDVLYVPRGTGYDVRTSASLAVFLLVYVHTEERVVFSALQKGVDIARRSSDMLDTALQYDEESEEGNDDVTGTESVAWADLLNTAVRMAGEFTPALRRFLPTTGGALHAMQSVGVVSGEALVRDSLARFTVAARTALFDPVIQLLSDDGESASVIAPPSLIRWAKYVAGSQTRLSQAKNNFLAAVDAFSKSALTPADIIDNVNLDWYEREPQRKERDQVREKCLRLHGQPLERRLRPNKSK